MRYTLLIILAAFTVSGCNPEMRELERASCGLPEGCYAPGVTPGTNPYREPDNNKNFGLLHRNSGSWLVNGNRMCSYSDGSVINIGTGICPLNRP